jgi:hypothetical protein
MLTLKVLHYHEERTKPGFVSHPDLFGENFLYPEGSTRIVKAYFLFPETLSGERKRGIQYVEQEARIAMSADGDTAFNYNSWQNRRFVPKENLESTLNNLDEFLNKLNSK